MEIKATFINPVIVWPTRKATKTWESDFRVCYKCESVCWHDVLKSNHITFYRCCNCNFESEIVKL